MSSRQIASMHTVTPTLVAVDPRGLDLQTVHYHRNQVGTPAQTRSTRQTYDSLGRLSASVDPRLGQLPGQVNYSWHLSLSANTLLSNSVDSGWRLHLLSHTGQPSRSWDGRGHVLQREYDGLDRLVAVTEMAGDQAPATVERLRYGLGNAESAVHNQCGQLVRQDDHAGSQSTSDFGLTGLPIVQARRFTRSLADPDWPPDEGEREAMLEALPATTRWTCNALSEVVQLIDCRENIRRNVHDLNGNLKQVYLQIKGAVEKPILQSISYNLDNRIEHEVAGNGVITRADYDMSNGRLQHLSCTATTQRLLQSLRYAYDPVGNVVQIMDEVAPVAFFRNQQVEHCCTYGYDSLYQLIWSTGFEAIHALNAPSATGARDPAQVAGYREDYEYDEAGNLHTLVHAGGNHYTRRTVTAAGSNRSLAVHGEEIPGEPEIAAAFDGNGNSRELLRAQALDWDARNQLHGVTPVSRPDGEDDSETYRYDSQGQRLRKSTLRWRQSGSVIRETRYLPGIELHADSSTGKAYHVVRVMAGLSSIGVMHWESSPPSGMQPEHWTYSLPDHLGSSSVELDSMAQVLSREWYLPYGGTAWWEDDGSPQAGYKTLGYCSKERDASGLYCFGRRYYASWLQRWINPDPAGPIDGLNLYRFVRNNPLTLMDADGLAPVSLLYGFEHVRTRVLPGLVAQSAHQSFVRIDEINDALQINMDNASEDFAGFNEMIREGIEVEEDSVDYFMASTPSFKGTPEEARGLLQGWSDYLKTHASAFDITRKMSTYQNTSSKDVVEFWKKNLRQPLSAQEVEAATSMLNSAPDDLFSQRTASSIVAADAVINWQFRQFSKLALDWMAGDPDANDESQVIFLDVVARSPDFVFKDFGPSTFGVKPYKESGAAFGKSYNPITHSERRHLQRNTLSPDSSYSRRVRMVGLDQARQLSNN